MRREALVVRQREGRGRQRGQRRLVILPIGDRHRNVRAVTPPLTLANPPVGSVAGTPMTKFATLIVVSCPSRASPA